MNIDGKLVFHMIFFVFWPTSPLLWLPIFFLYKPFPSLLVMNLKLPRMGSRDSFQKEEVKEDDLPPPCEDLELKKLKRLLQSIERTDDLVLQLISRRSKKALKIRFLIAYKEFKETVNQNERTNKGRMIINWFFLKDSRFRLEGLPNTLEKELQKFKLQKLELVENLFFTELLKDVDVLEVLAGLEEEERS